MPAVPVSSVRSAASSAEVSIEVEETLLLKSAQSVAVRRPRFATDDDGRLKVMVFPDAVMVKSVPVVEVASVWVAPVCV